AAPLRSTKNCSRSKCDKRILFREAGVEVAVVGGFILLAGGDKALDPVRHVQATFDSRLVGDCKRLAGKAWCRDSWHSTRHAGWAQPDREKSRWFDGGLFRNGEGQKRLTKGHP
ncbi:hypothetical protein P0D88_38425, partial [Paraburkholderia sp. RL18-103-BIB-C]